MLHRNGTPPAPDIVRGTPGPPGSRTEFPPDRPINTERAWAYHLGRQRMAGLSLLRWLYLVLITFLLFLLLQPGLIRWGALALLLILLALWSRLRYVGSREFVRFVPQPLLPTDGPITPWPLTPSDKLPVYVSGLLSVDTKARHFAALPGFYRTFATREHALLCQARPRRLGGVATWPEEEVGLWYAFFQAPQVRQLRTGLIAFDRAELPGFAVEYELAKPLDGKSKRHSQQIALYVAFPHAADCQAALADLMVEPTLAAQMQSSET